MTIFADLIWGKKVRMTRTRELLRMDITGRAAALLSKGQKGVSVFSSRTPHLDQLDAEVAAGGGAAHSRGQQPVKTFGGLAIPLGSTASTASKGAGNLLSVGRIDGTPFASKNSSNSLASNLASRRTSNAGHHGDGATTLVRGSIVSTAATDSTTIGLSRKFASAWTGSYGHYACLCLSLDGRTPSVGSGDSICFHFSGDQGPSGSGIARLSGLETGGNVAACLPGLAGRLTAGARS